MFFHKNLTFYVMKKKKKKKRSFVFFSVGLCVFLDFEDVTSTRKENSPGSSHEKESASHFRRFQSTWENY